MKANCTVCGTEYAARKGKIYCSDSCKTKAYEMRKAGKEVTGETERPKGSAIFFDIAEYETCQPLFSNFGMSFASYCFFRKNLPNNLKPEKIAALLDGYWDSGMIDTSGNIEPKYTALENSFQEFQKNFFSGLFEIRDTREVAA